MDYFLTLLRIFFYSGLFGLSFLQKALLFFFCKQSKCLWTWCKKRSKVFRFFRLWLFKLHIVVIHNLKHRWINLHLPKHCLLSRYWVLKRFASRFRLQLIFFILILVELSYLNRKKINSNLFFLKVSFHRHALYILKAKNDYQMGFLKI